MERGKAPYFLKHGARSVKQEAGRLHSVAVCPRITPATFFTRSREVREELTKAALPRLDHVCHSFLFFLSFVSTS
jgi:hypothetical protein